MFLICKKSFDENGSGKSTLVDLNFCCRLLICWEIRKMEPFSFVNPVTDSTLSLLFILMERSDIVSFSGIYTHGDIGHCPIHRYLFSWRDRTLSYFQVFTLNERSDTVLSQGIFTHGDIGNWLFSIYSLGEIGHFLLLRYLFSWRDRTLS